MECEKPLSHELSELAEVFEEMYGRGGTYRDDPSLSGEPDDVIGTLLVTILSQASSDDRTRRIYRQLTELFPTPEALAGAGAEQIEEILRPGGLAEQKAKYLRGVLARVREDMGEYSLEALRDESDEACRRYLTSLPGVGEKTAACVLLFGLGRDVFPVDTHVARISRRLGLVGENASPDRIYRELAPHIPPGAALGLHLNMLEHGRRICLAVNPRCAECRFFSRCPWPDREEREVG